MDINRFRDSSAEQLVRAGEGDTAYWAFVPHPLPPAIEPDWALARALSEADRALSKLAGVGRTMPNPHLLIGPFVRREAVLSSRIEGTQADIADLYAYQVGQLSLPGVSPAPPESDVREVLNYANALEYGLERLETLPVSLRLIRELHERLMSDVRGEYATPDEFRRSQNWIGPPGCTLMDALFVPPPVPQMHGALDAFEKYLHGDDIYPPADHLFAAPVITIPEAQRVLNVTYPTAQRNVARLVSAGILEQSGESGYGKTFVTHEILEVIDTNPW